MENYKSRFLKCVEEDRISNLPEPLVDSILDRLPVKDAVKTSIISKRWRYKWNTMRVLVFDENFSKIYAKNGAFSRNGFIRIINQVVLLHMGPILKFHLHIPNISLDSFQEVDQWMQFLSRKGVTELVLTISSRRYRLSSHVFSCLELTKLKLENCLFKPPLEFKGSLNLEDVFFKNIDFGTNLWGTEINLPQLKELSMYTCTNVHNFNIKATKLQILRVSKCPDAMLLQLILHSPCLTRVAICFLTPIEENVRVERMTLAMMLSNLPNITHFHINDHFLKSFDAESIPKWIPHPLNSLEHLWLQDFQHGDLDQLHGALCLLRNSPNLKELCIIRVKMELIVDVGPASNHLEAPNCFDCILSQLQTVKITSLRGSRPELLFIKLLLAHSPSLEKFTISPSVSCDAKNILNISKDVMRFPRASPKAELIYLNSEPMLCYELITSI